MTMPKRASNQQQQQQQRSAPTDSLLFEQPFIYNYASSSKPSSPTSTHGPLSSQSTYLGREGRVQDPYRAIADDARRLRRARQQQQAARQRRSLDYPATPDFENDNDDDEDDCSEYDAELDDQFPTNAATVSMRRLGSNDSHRQHRARTISGSSITSSIAFPAAPPSPRTSTSAGSSPSALPTGLPNWPPTPMSATKYDIDDYSFPDDPTSPFTHYATLVEDEDAESDDESSRRATKPISSTRRGVIRLANLASRNSDSKRRPSIEIPTSPIMTSSTSVRSVDSLPDTAESPSAIDSARRQWELLSLRVSLRVFHAKQHFRNGSNSRRGVPVV